MIFSITLLTSQVLVAGGGSSTSFLTKGNYLGGSIISSILEPNVPLGDVTEESAFGYEVYVGHKLTDRFAIEAFYTDLGAADI